MSSHDDAERFAPVRTGELGGDDGLPLATAILPLAESLRILYWLQLHLLSYRSRRLMVGGSQVLKLHIRRGSPPRRIHYVGCIAIIISVLAGKPGE